MHVTATFCHFNIGCKRGLRSMIFYDELVIPVCDSRHFLSLYFFTLSESDKAPHYNERADKLASDAAKLQESYISIDYNFLFSLLRSNMNLLRSHKWEQSNQKLRDIKVNLDYWPPLCKSRREEVVINRLRLGHCWFSHHHLIVWSVNRDFISISL